MGVALLFEGTTEIATISQTFMVNQVPQDPTTVSLTVTDPYQVATTYTYNPGTITRLDVGVYTQNVSVPSDGLWAYQWNGTGAASDVQPGTFRVFPLTQNQQYAGVEELKDRLRITDSDSDFQLYAAINAASRFVERHCGRYFYQSTATRTYVPYNIYELPVDDIVSITQLAVDYNGVGVYDTIWSPNQYQLAIGETEFTALAAGEPRPWTLIRVTQTGQFFPFIWPFSRIDRIQVQAVFGWPAVPVAVMEATVMVAADLFKLKDTPFGLAAGGEYGLVRVRGGASPVVLDLLMPYRSPRRKIGM